MTQQEIEKLNRRNKQGRQPKKREIKRRNDDLDQGFTEKNNSMAISPKLLVPLDDGKITPSYDASNALNESLRMESFYDAPTGGSTNERRNSFDLEQNRMSFQTDHEQSFNSSRLKESFDTEVRG